VRRDTKPQSPVVIVAGPTASGKSALALELAAARGGTIINADSQQIYRDLSILSARPDAASIRRVPHRLYGFLDAAERGSVALWPATAVAGLASRARHRKAARRMAAAWWEAGGISVCDNSDHAAARGAVRRLRPPFRGHDRGRRDRGGKNSHEPRFTARPAGD